MSAFLMIMLANTVGVAALLLAEDGEALLAEDGTEIKEESVDDWLLADGFWDDAGIWDDAAFWPAD